MFYSSNIKCCFGWEFIFLCITRDLRGFVNLNIGDSLQFWAIPIDYLLSISFSHMLFLLELRSDTKINRFTLSPNLAFIFSISSSLCGACWLFISNVSSNLLNLSSPVSNLLFQHSLNSLFQWLHFSFLNTTLFQFYLIILIVSYSFHSSTLLFLYTYETNFIS